MKNLAILGMRIISDGPQTTSLLESQQTYFYIVYFLGLLACFFLFGFLQDQDEFFRQLSYSRRMIIRINDLQHKITKQSLAKVGPDIDCSICLEPILKRRILFIPGCEHFYHLRCLRKWLDEKDNCPICRSNIEESLRPLEIEE